MLKCTALRLESLEDRQLLSVTDVAEIVGIANVSNEQPVSVACNDVQDEIVDLSALQSDVALPATLCAARTASASSVYVDFGVRESVAATYYQVEFADNAAFENSTTNQYKYYSNVGVAKISDLASDTTFYFRARTVDADGEPTSEWSDMKVAATLAADDATTVPTLTFETTSSTSFVVTIDRATVAESYTVEYSTDPDFADASTKTFTRTGFAGISNLEPDTTYYVRVCASTPGNPSTDWSDVLAVTTDAVLPATLCAARVASASSVYVDYGVRESVAATYYQVEFADNAAFENSTTNQYKYYSTVGVAKISNLASGTTFYFRARTVDAAGEPTSAWSDTKVAATLAADDVTTVPTLTFESATTTSFVVTIDRATVAESYILEYSTDPDFADSSTKTFTRTGFAGISNLEPGTTYYVRVCASTPGNPNTDWSDVLAVTTESRVVLPMTLCAARTASASSVYVDYGVRESVAATHYQVEFADNAAFENSTTNQYKYYSTVGVAKISNLASGTTFYFRARTVDAAGEPTSEWSDTKVAATLAADDATTVPTLTFESATTTSFIVTIDRPTVAESYILEYSTDPDFADSSTKTFTRTGFAGISNLEPGTTYYLRACASTSGNPNTDWSDVLAVTTESRAAGPTISARVVGTTSAYVQWTEVEAASGYIWQVSKNADFSDAVDDYRVNADNRLLSNLEVGETYYTRVKATFDGGPDSEWSNVAVVDLPSEEEILTPPECVPTAKSETQINVKVSRPYVSQSLVVEYSTDPTFTENVGTKSFTRNGVGAVNGLKSGTVYYFRAKAVTVDGDTPWSEVASAKTFGEPAMDAPVLSVRTASVTSGYVKYEVPSENIAVVVERSTDPSFASDVVTLRTNGSGTTLNAGLQADTTYYYRAKAVDGERESDWSDVTSFTTLPSNDTKTVASILNVETLTDSKIAVTYARENIAEKYILEVAIDENFENVVKTTTYTSAAKVCVHSLDAGTTYYFRMRCATRSNDGSNTLVYTDWSETFSATTLNSDLDVLA